MNISRNRTSARAWLLFAPACFTSIILATGAIAAEAGRNAATGDSDTLTEVIVTASRFAENVQKSSLPVTVLSADELIGRNIADAKDLNALVAGVIIGSGGINNNIYIRGVGSYVTAPYQDPSTAFNLDGVNVSRPTATSGMFFDLNRVEVLKGPQGTLYGRNSTGGAINVVTNNPVIGGGFNGYLDAGFGNYGAFQSQGAVNLPISGALAGRVAFQTSKHDGYLSDGSNDQDMYAVRAKLLFASSDDFSVLFTGDYSHMGGAGPGGVLTPLVDPSNPWIGAADQRSLAVRDNQPPVPLAPLVPGQSQQVIISDGVSAQMDWNLGFATLTVLPAFRHLTVNAYTFTGGFGTDDVSVESQTSVEARLAQHTDAIKWVVGAYYFDETQTANEQGFLTPLAYVQYDLNRVPDRTWASFGEATITVLPDFRLIGGLRYTKEDKSVGGIINTVAFGTTLPTAPFVGSATFSNTSWRAGAEYDLRPDSLLYATASTGFHSGGFYADVAPYNSYKPETLTAYTLGLKNRFLDNRLQLNVEAFYWKYNNQQIAITGFNHIGSPGTVVVNAGNSTLKGLDVSTVYKPDRHDAISADLEYNDTKYTSFTYLTPIAAPPPDVGCGVTPLPAKAAYSVDCTGNRLQRAPLWSGNLSYSHSFDLSNEATINAAANAYITSSYYTGIEHLPTEFQGGYTIGNVDVTYAAPKNAWAVTGYVHNLANKGALSGGFLLPFINLTYSTILPPRTFGLRVTVNF